MNFQYLLSIFCGPTLFGILKSSFTALNVVNVVAAFLHLSIFFSFKFHLISFFYYNFISFCLAETSAGSNGQVDKSYLQKLSLGPEQIKKYPLSLLKLMTRYAEDLIWANKISNGKAIFKFLRQLTRGRADASKLRKGNFLFPAGFKFTRKKYIFTFFFSTTTS